jgi:biopolymer transport protein ExbD
MKTWMDEIINEKVGLQIAPLIDCVFLLLIYFMVSSSLKRSEADLSLTLPGQVIQSKELKMPDEQIIEVLANGSIVLNEKVYAGSSRTDLDRLERTLTRYREASLMANTPAMITIVAQADSLHARVIDVLNACAGAGITSVTFGNTE